MPERSDVDLTCARCRGDASALRLRISETTWYMLDVTARGIYPHDAEADHEPLLEIVCLDCGHHDAPGARVRALLQLE